MTITNATPDEIKLLNEAFAKFNETSEQLQLKYRELLEESNRLRETVKEKEKEIKNQEKLVMLGETAAAIAHEVRNPLGAIKLFVSLLRSDCSEKPESLQLIDQIDASIDSLDNVVTNILQFSKDKKLSFTPVNIHSIIQEQLLSFPRTEVNQASFELNLLANPFIFASETAIRQIFYNLILNSLQATKYSGKIFIKTNDVTDGIQILIQDNGPGIPNELLETVFEPFVTSRNEGTGLGLAIVKQLVTRHFGSISASNNGGAELKLVFPRTLKEIAV